MLLMDAEVYSRLPNPYPNPNPNPDPDPNPHPTPNPNPNANQVFCRDALLADVLCFPPGGG